MTCPPPTTLVMYADDTAIYASSWNPTQATKYLQKHLNLISEYTKTCRLKIYPTKPQAITFTRKYKIITENVHIDGHVIPWSGTVKYLRIILDSKLTWARAIEKRAYLAYSVLNRLYSLIARNSNLKKSIKIQLYLTCDL